jgi:tripartite-type tricarboxylate transporter receptor subunit TctC
MQQVARRLGFWGRRGGVRDGRAIDEGFRQLAAPYVSRGSSATRSEVLPHIPTVSEFVPGYEATGWGGLGAPRNTPAEIVAKLNKEINAGLADPAIKARIADLGSVPMPMTAADFAKFIVAETEKWDKVVKFAGIKPE